MGCVVFACLAAGALLVLWRAGIARALWPMAAGAVALGGVGYAVGNHAALPGRPVARGSSTMTIPADELALRDAMLGAFSADHAFLVMSDGLLRAGRRESSAQVLLRALGSYPKSLTLWVGLGSAIARHDGGQVSPTARFAFARAAQLAPLHPAPPFFAGMAYVRAGDLRTARRYWARALVLTPREVSYRPDVALRLALLDRFLAETAGAPPD